MTQRLPVIKIHILTTNVPLVLSWLLDTCAGTTLGLFSYHKRIANLYKHLVLEFTILKEENYCEEPIGGVDGKEGSVKIIAAIVYLLLYSINGKRAKLRVGLCEQLAAKTIIGLTMQRSLKMSINLGNDTVFSPVIQESFKIKYEQPQADPTPPEEFPGKKFVLVSDAVCQAQQSTLMIDS
jgi:hypothetical protein